jgi:hypothetical protein
MFSTSPSAAGAAPCQTGGVELETMWKRYIVAVVGACLMAGPVVSAQLVAEEGGGAAVRFSAEEMHKLRAEGGMLVISRQQLEAFCDQVGEIAYEAGKASCGPRT